MRRPEPLKIERQGGVRRERIGLACWQRLNWGGERCWDLDRRDLSSMSKMQPAVLAPHTFLDSRLSPERRAPEAPKRPRAKVRVINLPVRRLDNLSVSGALQVGVRRVL